MGRRPPQTLCAACHRRFELGRKREQEIRERDASGEKIRVVIDTKFHYGTPAHLSFLGISGWDVLDALVRLARLEKCQRGLFETARPIHYKYSRGDGWRNRPHQHVWATPGQADDIELVLNYIELAIKKAYEDGLADGRSLIKTLATVGVAEINRMTTGVKK
jgi:hypothetical protein